MFSTRPTSTTPPADATAPPPALQIVRAEGEARPFRIERLDAVEARAHGDAWLDLMGRALEPNAFLDPDFALPAAQHLAGARRPCFLLVWAAGPGGSETLAAVCPVVGRPDPLRALASAWFHDLAALGFPVLDRERGGEAMRALLLWAAQGGLPGARGVALRALPEAGPTAALLRRVAAEEGLGFAVLDAWERALLRRDGESGRAGLPALSPGAAKELRRQRRRLAERGALTHAVAREGDDLAVALERFLALEAAGWKGAAGTALLMDPGRTAFARAASRLLARRGLCRIHSLTLDGLPIAMAIVLSAGVVDFLWKIAYREADARFSPGVLLVLDITEAQALEGRAVSTDSCAVPDHPMIDRLWRDRLPLVDVALALRRGRFGGFEVAVAAERGGRRLRARAKRAVLAWRARRAAKLPRRQGAPAPGA